MGNESSAAICQDCKATVTPSGYCVMCGRYNDASAEREEEEASECSTFDGQNVVISGTVDGYSRAGASALFASAGAHVQERVTRDTNILVVGARVGATKLKKAGDLGVEIIPFEVAKAMLEGRKTEIESIPADTVIPAKLGEPIELGPGRRQIFPMLCKGVTAMPKGDGWTHEIKWDGYRAVAYVDGTDAGGNALASRAGKDLHSRFPQVLEELIQTLTVSCVLDGEIVVLDENNHANLELLHKGTRDVEAKFAIFDVLECDGVNLRVQTLSKRKELLHELIDGGGKSFFETPTFMEEEREALLAFAVTNDLEGVVSKRVGSIYREKSRAGDWVKFKLRKQQEFVVMGWTAGEGTREGTAGSFLLGVNDGTKAKPKWTYVGSVGTGGTIEDFEKIRSQLADIDGGTASRTMSTQNFIDSMRASMTHAERENTTFVRPAIVLDVKFQKWTEDGKLWHPSIQGQRKDKEPREVTREP